MERDVLLEYTNYIQEKYNVVLILGNKRTLSDYLDTDCIVIGYIQVDEDERNKGKGTKVLKEITRWADKNRYILMLNPSPKEEARLIKFYSRFDFIVLQQEDKENLFGKLADETKEKMIRFNK